MSNVEFTSDSIRSAKFREKLKGYHPDDVDAFLDRAAEAFDRVQDRLREIERATDPVTDESLRRTLVLAQRTAEVAVQEATVEASRILSAARAEADGLLAEADRDADRAKATARARLREAEERVASQEAQAARRIEAFEAEAAAQVENTTSETRRRLQASVRALQAQEERLRAQTTELSAYLATERTRILGVLASAADNLDTSLTSVRAVPENDAPRYVPEPTAAPRIRPLRARATDLNPSDLTPSGLTPSGLAPDEEPGEEEDPDGAPAALSADVEGRQGDQPAETAPVAPVYDIDDDSPIMRTEVARPANPAPAAVRLVTPRIRPAIRPPMGRSDDEDLAAPGPVTAAWRARTGRDSFGGGEAAPWETEARRDRPEAPWTPGGSLTGRHAADRDPSDQDPSDQDPRDQDPRVEAAGDEADPKVDIRDSVGIDHTGDRAADHDQPGHAFEQGADTGGAPGGGATDDAGIPATDAAEGDHEPTVPGGPVYDPPGDADDEPPARLLFTLDDERLHADADRIAEPVPVTPVRANRSLIKRRR